MSGLVEILAPCPICRGQEGGCRKCDYTGQVMIEWAAIRAATSQDIEKWNNQPHRVVTAEQLALGYVDHYTNFEWTRPYFVLRKNDNGTFVVQDHPRTET